MSIETSFDLEKHMAVIQMKHYLHLQHSAIATGDHHECRRATIQLDRLVNEHGVSALHQAQDEYK